MMRAIGLDKSCTSAQLVGLALLLSQLCRSPQVDRSRQVSRATGLDRSRTTAQLVVQVSHHCSAICAIQDTGLAPLLSQMCPHTIYFTVYVSSYCHISVLMQTIPIPWRRDFRFATHFSTHFSTHFTTQTIPLPVATKFSALRRRVRWFYVGDRCQVTKPQCC